MRRGFTLIELLVVIAIIAILAAILFPVFARAREKARQSSCLSNVRQLSTAILMYVQDYDERFPGHRCCVRSGFGYWYQLIEPYTKNAGIFTCPSDPATSLGYGYNGAGTTADNALGWRYATSSGVAPNQWAPLIGKVRQPSLMIMIADQAGNSTGDMSARTGSYTVAPRHNEGCNVGHVDGHAKWYKASVLMSNLTDWWQPSAHPELKSVYQHWVRDPESGTGK
ncbi:MAG: prepilin-type N-terminal cleavage/methylation domain-containing protein [candidate division WS1 bacterium]|nr:prepilin-type N-terminal cleavage/methylation domain-containing protein [candidate division WS1 bacterium]